MVRTVKVCVILIMLIMALALISSKRVQAQRPFSEATIKGSWGFHAFGTNTGSNPVAPLAAIVAVGRITYDGQGGCEVRDTVNFDATGTGIPIPPTGISRVSSECDYYVNADGSGAVHIEFFGPSANGAEDEVHLAFVIEDNANAMRLVRTDQVAIAQGTSTRQQKSRVVP